MTPHCLRLAPSATQPPSTFCCFYSHSVFFERLTSLNGALVFFTPIILTAHYKQPRRHGLIPGHLAFFSVSLSILSSFYQSPLLSMNPIYPSPRSLPALFLQEYTHTHGAHSHTHACKCVTYMQTNTSYLPIFTQPSLALISHTLSCNSILIGFIGLAIHLSAAAQFNYIREPSGPSPDNLQHSPPSRTHTHTRAPFAYSHT